DDNTLVQGVEGEATSWGFFGYAYYQNNKEGLKDIKVAEEGTEGIQPTTETITSGDYPLSRPLFIYVKEASPKRIADVGYVAAPQDDYSQGLTKLQPFLTTS